MSRGAATFAALVLSATSLSVQTGPIPPPPDQQPSPLAPVTNVQVLKGLPRDQVVLAMTFISGALGVSCTFCHVRTDQGIQFELDDKAEKTTARRMMLMTAAINDQQFQGAQRVTCATCHDGRPQPRTSSPVVTERRGAQPSLAGHVPSAADLFAKDETAIGGGPAIDRLFTRVERYTTSRDGAVKTERETWRKAPDKVLDVRIAGGSAREGVAFDGVAGHRLGPGGTNAIVGADLDNLKLVADFWRTLRLASRYRTTSAVTVREVNGRQAYAVRGTVRDSNVEEELFFDVDSSLLVRRRTYRPTALGPATEQIDFDDYRTVDGIKMPFALTIADGESVTTRTYEEIRFNIPVDDSRFAGSPVGSAR